MIFRALAMLLLAAEDGCRYLEEDTDRTTEDRIFYGRIKWVIVATMTRLPLIAWQRGKEK